MTTARNVAGFPFVVTISTPRSEVLASWYDEAVEVSVAALAVVLSLVALFGLLSRHIAKRAQAETALRASQELLDGILNTIPVRVFWKDKNLSFLGCNLAFAHDAGFSSPRDIVGKSDYQMVWSDQAELYRSDDRKVIESGHSKLLIEEPQNTPDGRTLTLLTSKIPLRGRDGEIDGVLGTYMDVTEKREAEAAVAHLARHDALTDLPNRILFREQLERSLAFGRRGEQLALLCLDLAQFKTVNDTLGHPIGDGLLQAVADRLTQQARQTDCVARLGGDEFAIIQTMIEKPADATTLASRLIGLLAQPFDVAGHQIVVGTSVGIAFAPQDGEDADELLKKADLALYRAKQDGRGVYRLFQIEMDQAMRARRALDLALRQALPRRQLELYFQPMMDVPTRSVIGFEALLRWHHPEMGLLMPDRFIPLAEEIGAIIPIGEWIMREACRIAVSWPAEMKVAVNLSPIQFKSHDLVGMVASALKDANLPPHRLELEITETVMLEDTDDNMATLRQLRALGLRIAMDDFGTGYSSLSYLRRFPFDCIKIDRSFVKELGRKQDCDAIIHAVVALSRELGIATTAEGVENVDQLRILAQTGCSNIQGYLLSPPVPATQVRELLRTMPRVDDLLANSHKPMLNDISLLERATAC